MKMVNIIKGGLFIYEGVRIILLVLCLIFVLPGISAVSWLAFAVPGALFPLMAMFIWLDISRYNAYLPLYIAGKCIGIFSLIVFSIVSGRFTMIDIGSGIFFLAGLTFLAGDLLALAGILYIFNNFNNMMKLNEPVLEETETPDTEGKQ
jgi:hypothetical protein